MRQTGTAFPCRGEVKRRRINPLSRHSVSDGGSTSAPARSPGFTLNFQPSTLNRLGVAWLDAYALRAHTFPMSSGSDAVSRVGKLYAATGNELVFGLPRGETLRGLSREAKPFTRMAKWEIWFQRFAISFRPSAKVLVFGLPRGETLRGLSREVKPYTRGNEKFHLSPRFVKPKVSY
jgi:hypothetical protein